MASKTNQTHPESHQPVIFGEVLLDYFPERKILGGAPFNVAWNLQAFGAEPVFVSAVGDDADGREVLASMSDWGMQPSHVAILDSHATGKVEVTFKEGEPSYEIIENRSNDFIEADADPLRDGALLYHGSLAIRGERSRQTLAEIKSRFRGQVFVDLNIRPPWFSKDDLPFLISDVDWLKLSDGELEEITGTSNHQAGVSPLFESYHPRHILVTCGGDGAFLYQPDQDPIHVPSPEPEKMVDTVGAGDAFASVCIHGIINQQAPEAFLKRAVTFASRVCTMQGATTKDRSFYQNV